MLRVQPDYFVEVSVHCLWRLLRSTKVAGRAKNAVDLLGGYRVLYVLVVLLPLFIQQSRFFLARSHVVCTIISLCGLGSATPCPLDFKLVNRIARAEVLRLSRGDSCRDEVSRASAGCCAILVDQAPVAGVIVHFHEFDDAFGGICEAFLALHDALELLLLDLERLAGKLVIKL